MIDTIIENINDALYTYILIILLVCGGLYFSFKTKFVQFRLFKEQLKAVTEKPTDKNSVSSFQALMVSTASRVGTGNIIGVSTSICLGGFGSIFWMWLIAIIGSASAFVESTLAQIFKKKGKEGSYGGPAYYIEAAFKSKALATLFSVLLIITYAIGFNMLASYNLQSTFSAYSFYNKSVTPWVIGFIVAAVVLYCLMGGGKRIVKVTTVVVPIMGIIYIAVAILVVILNYKMLPEVFSEIFNNAFDFKAIFGGFTGSSVMYGIKRGLFSNEAGVGSAPNASAAAEINHPAKQGLVQVLSVFIDTILICGATAFMCMCSGIKPNEAISGAPYVQISLKAVFGSIGPVFITVAMLFFAFTTLLGNLFYVDKAFDYIFSKTPPKTFITAYRIIASLVIFVGAGLNADLLWNIADVTMGLMTLINMPVILYMGKYAFSALKDYERKLKNKEKLNFSLKDIGLNIETDYWK